MSVVKSKRPGKAELLSRIAEVGEQETAEHYKVCLETVRAWRRSYGVYHKHPAQKRPPKSQLKDMLAYFRVGEVAELYEVHPATVWDWKKHYCISTSRAKENHWRCKVPQAVVEEIRRRGRGSPGNPGEPLKDLAKEFGISASTVSEYCNYRTRV